MRLAMTMVSYAYDGTRCDALARSLPSLARTNVIDLEKPVLRITYKPALFDYTSYFEVLKQTFDLEVGVDPPDLQWPEYSHYSRWCSKLQGMAIRKVFEEYHDVTHVALLWDDFIYNPEWLRELAKLIERHPDGIAWSVYRSSYTSFHRIIGGDGNDVLMTMHDGVGCVTKEEFFAGLDRAGSDDCEHAARRPGNRWATKRDYCQNLCRHSFCADVDCAIDFVGE
jgi:hypothetical protein